MATCDHDGCCGRRFAGRHCIEHITESELLAAAQSLRSGEPLDARGATISEAALRRLLDALADKEHEAWLTSLDPDRSAPVITGSVHFDKATFSGFANFAGVTFSAPAYFDGATFQEAACFERCTFSEHADFDGVTFSKLAAFSEAIFKDHAGFQGASFQDTVAFDAVKFRSYVDLENATVDGDANMQGATFQLARQVGPFVVGEHLALDESVFGERVTMEVLASRISAWGAIFAGGVRLSVDKADMEFDCVDFGRSATLSRATRSAFPVTKGRDSRWSNRANRQPRLLTICGAQVASLSISGTNLRDCSLFGAHGVESLIVEPSCEWRHTPRSRLCIDREIIAEERDWHLAKERQFCADHGRRRRFAVNWEDDPAPDRPEEDCDDDPLRPDQLAALYRALRKAGEDNNDQAGASDFYYGEMEMRRRMSIPAGRGRWRAHFDRAVISAYWLLAGYGLRAWRSLATLAAVVLGASLILWQVGFRDSVEPTTFLHAGRVAVASATSLVRPVDDSELNGVGFGIEIALRFTGPVLLTLSALAVRARIKR